MNSTGLYCTNCNKEFEEFEDVTVVTGGVVEPFLDVDHYVAVGDGPNYQTLCKKCAALLVEPSDTENTVHELFADYYGHGGALTYSETLHKVHAHIEELTAERPNRVVVEVQGGAVTMVRATRPNDVMVKVLDLDEGFADSEDGMPIPVEVWGQGGIPIGKLNMVKEVNGG